MWPVGDSVRCGGGEDGPAAAAAATAAAEEEGGSDELAECVDGEGCASGGWRLEGRPLLRRGEGASCESVSGMVGVFGVGNMLRMAISGSFGWDSGCQVQDHGARNG